MLRASGTIVKNSRRTGADKQHLPSQDWKPATARSLEMVPGTHPCTWRNCQTNTSMMKGREETTYSWLAGHDLPYPVIPISCISFVPCLLISASFVKCIAASALHTSPWLCSASVSGASLFLDRGPGFPEVSVKAYLVQFINLHFNFKFFSSVELSLLFFFP